MFQRNSIVSGLVFGLLLPTVCFGMLFALFNLLHKIGDGTGIGLTENFLVRTSAIVSIAVNLLPMNQFRARRMDLSMRGVVIATGLLALVWVVYFGREMF